jgi:hypothetical protein
LIYYDGLKRGVQKSRWEYYDLNTDPGESLNAYDTALDQKKEETLKMLLSDWRETLRDE